MAKYCVVDFRMRKIEKEYIASLGYEVIQNDFDLNVYDEIAAHVDVYYTKIGNVIFAAPNKKDKVPFTVQLCTSEVGKEYPHDVPYNVCIIGNKIVHNFKYTDPIIKMYLEKNNYQIINVEQGYSNCSIAVIDNDSCITSDISIARSLVDAGIDTLYVSEPDIRLKKRTNSIFVDQSKMSFCDSEMSGFIGGAMTRLGDQVIVFGDINKLTNGKKIKSFIEKKGLKLHYFEGLDVVDYGGVLEVIE